MKKASISDAKNRLSALIDGLRSGTPVLIVDRGRPVARLEAVHALSEDAGGVLARLVRDCVVRPPRESKRRPAATSTVLPEATRSALQVLLDDRREGR